jgi:hypothetical protein
MERNHKYKVDHGSRSIYRYYVKKTGNPKNLSNAEYSRLLKKYNQGIVRLMIYDSYTYVMPHGFGTLSVRKRKIDFKLNEDGNLDKRGLSVDWKKTRELWYDKYSTRDIKKLKLIDNKPIVYHENRHTDGYRHRYFWDRITSVFKKQSYYIIIFNRNNKRLLSKALQNINHLDFSEIPKYYENKKNSPIKL